MKEPDRNISVLLIKRKNDPYKNHWACPGGFLDVDTDKTLLDCANRELQEETGIPSNILRLEQCGTVGDIHRDERGRVISVAFTDVIDYIRIERYLKAGDDAKQLTLHPLTKVMSGCFHIKNIMLAFDHKDIIYNAIEKVMWRLW